jgi:hypothetical protein
VDVERLKERLADAATSALDAGLELAKLFYVLVGVAAEEDLEPPTIDFPDVEYVSVELCEKGRKFCDSTIFVIERDEPFHRFRIRIRGKPLCFIAGEWYPPCRVDEEYINESSRRLKLDFLTSIYEMARAGLLDKLVELLDMVVERVERGEYEYDDKHKLAEVTVPVGDGQHEVRVEVKTAGRSAEAVVGALRWARDFIKILRDSSRWLSESGLVDRITDRILRGAMDAADSVVDSVVQELGRERLVELVKEAVGEAVDKILDALKSSDDKSSLNKLVFRLLYSSTRFMLGLSDGEVFVLEVSGDEICRLKYCGRREHLAKVELPDYTTVEPWFLRGEFLRYVPETKIIKYCYFSHFGEPQTEHLLTVCEPDFEGEPRFETPVVLLTREERDGVPRVYLDAVGLALLGVYDKVIPGTTGKILQKVRKAVRERIRKLVVTEFLYSALREWMGSGRVGRRF